MTNSETRSMDLDMDFNIAMAEKTIRQLDILGNAQTSIRQLQKEVKSKSNSDFFDCLYFLGEYAAIRMDREYWRRGQKITITLSKIGEQILNFGIIREYLDYRHNGERSSKTGIKKPTISKFKKAIEKKQGEDLTRGVFGVSYARIVDQSKENLEPGDFGWDNSRMLRVYRHKDGVSPNDLIEQRDIGCSGIFSGIKVSSSNPKKLMHHLLEEGIMREIGEVDGEIRYGIADNTLRLYIEDHLGLHQTRINKIARILSTVRGIQRGTRQDSDVVNFFEENMDIETYEYLQKLEKIRRRTSANARVLYKNLINLHDDEEVRFYKNRIAHRKKMYEELEARYPVIIPIVKMFATSDYFDRMDERAIKRSSRKLNSCKWHLRRLYPTIKNKWQTYQELEQKFEECLPTRRRIEAKLIVSTFYNSGYLEIDNPANCRFKLSDKGKRYLSS